MPARRVQSAAFAYAGLIVGLQFAYPKFVLRRLGAWGRRSATPNPSRSAASLRSHMLRLMNCWQWRLGLPPCQSGLARLGGSTAWDVEAYAVRRVGAQRRGIVSWITVRARGCSRRLHVVLRNAL